MDLSRVDIMEAANQLGLELYPIQGGRQYTTRCWSCQGKGMGLDTKKNGHLTIRPDLQVFRCPRCGYSGNAFTMARDLLGEEQGRKFLNDMNSAARPVRSVIEEQQQVSVTERDVVYNGLLKRLVLSPSHRQDLRSRGLPDDVIDVKGYRSTLGWESAEGVCKLLIKEGLSLDGIPGFYKNQEGKWVFMTLPGFLIPVRNIQGQIQGLQIRVDNWFLNKKPTLKKYIWLSSVSKEKGTSSGAPVHIVCPENIRISSETKLWITEGPLKADIASLYMGITFMGIAGVSLYKQAANEVSNMGLRKTRVAYDTDLKENPHVKDAQIELLQELAIRGVKAVPVTWNDVFGKGIDDMLINISDGQYPVCWDSLRNLIHINKDIQAEMQVLSKCV